MSLRRDPRGPCGLCPLLHAGASMVVLQEAWEGELGRPVCRLQPRPTQLQFDPFPSLPQICK